MLSVILVFVWLVMIPFGCGLWITQKLSKEHRRPEIVLVNGYLVMIALFQCLYLCFVMLGSTSFKLLTWIFGIVIVMFFGVSVGFGKDVIKECVSAMKNKDAMVLKVLFALVILAQLIMRILQQVSDGDDAFYIATAAVSVSNGTMNYVQPYTGFVTNDLDLRHAFSAAPIWLAFLSKVTMVRPAMMAHSILAPVLILLHYSVILNLGKNLFESKKNQTYLFGVLVGIFNIYGYVSIYTAQTFFLTRTWQGKSIFANLFLPVLFLVMLWLAESKKNAKKDYIYYALAGMIMLGGTAMTTMAVFLLPMVFMLGMLFLAVCKKQPGMVLKGMLVCVPTVAVGLLYFMT